MWKYPESDNTRKPLPSLDLKGYSSQEKKISQRNKTKRVCCVCMNYKESAHAMMKVKKLHDLQSASWNPGELIDSRGCKFQP